MRKYKLVLLFLFFISPYITFAATGVTFTQASGGEAISASTALSGGTGEFTLLSGPVISEGTIGNIKSGTITLTAPDGFEFDTANPATVTIASSTSNPNTNINHLASGTVVPTVTTSSSISFTITSQSTSARNTLTWNNIRIRPTSADNASSGQIILSSTGVIQNLTLPIDAGLINEIPVPPTAPTFTEVTEDITEDTTWGVSGSPYLISFDINVDEDATLIIEPGVVVKFSNFATLRINGALEANGSSSDPIIFTSYKDDSMAGDTNNDNSATSPASSDWRGISFYNNEKDSNVSNAEVRYSNYGFANFGSTLNISDVGYSYADSGLISFYEGSSTIKNISFKNMTRFAISLYEGSHVDGDNINIYNLDEYADGIDLFEGSKLTLTNSSLKGSLGSYGILTFEGSDIDLDTVSVTGFDVGFADYGDSDSGLNNLNIKNSEIKNNDIGFLLFGEDSVYKITNNSISGNFTYGVKSYSENFLNFKNNYWGDESGPYNLDSNPQGLGSAVYNSPGSSQFVFKPWLKIWPTEEMPIEIKQCCSSVMFFPGIQGSRLYKERLLGGEDQLWEPNTPDDVADLYMDEEGNSINEVYTRDIIKETNLARDIEALRKKIYKSFSVDLDNLKTEGKIADWEPVAYDWRLGVDDIVNNGINLETSTINAISEVERMASDSQTGKVTLVGHSNGGLFIKYLLKRLEDRGEIELVDKVVLVGSPELGTPKGTLAILHGVQFEGFFNFIAPQKYNRQLALNIPGVYSLAPSRKLFESMNIPVVRFDESVGDLFGLVDAYGSSIDTYDVFKDFLLAHSDSRELPALEAVKAPAYGNELLLNKAESLHDIIDNYDIPTSIKKYGISGIGLSTPAGVVYKKNKFCILDLCHDGSQLVPEIINTVYGDGTVLNSSSSAMGGNQYIVNMEAYNKDNGTNYDHAFMMENISIKSLIENIILDIDETVPYVIDRSAKIKTKTKVVAMHSPVDIDLYDSEGRHTGKCAENPYPEMECIDAEIPNSSYTTMGEDKYISLPNEGSFTLKLDGYDSGTFTLNIDNYEDDTKVGGVEFTDITTNSLMLSDVNLTETLPTELLLDMNGDSKLDKKVTNTGETSDIVIQDEPIVSRTYGSSSVRSNIYPIQRNVFEKEKPVVVKEVKIKDTKIKKVVKKIVPNILAVEKVSIPTTDEIAKLNFNQTASVGNIGFNIFNYLFKLLFSY